VIKLSLVQLILEVKIKLEVLNNKGGDNTIIALAFPKISPKLNPNHSPALPALVDFDDPPVHLFPYLRPSYHAGKEPRKAS
jgi:hypothetical protein